MSEKPSSAPESKDDDMDAILPGKKKCVNLC
jgi:hypothetical protein